MSAAAVGVALKRFATLAEDRPELERRQRELIESIEKMSDVEHLSLLGW